MLLSNLLKSFTGLPKNKSAMLKKIGSIIRMYANSNEISADYKQTLDRNNRVRFWCLDLLKEKNIIICDQINNKNIQINKDQIIEYQKYMEKNIEACKQELLKMEFA